MVKKFVEEDLSNLFTTTTMDLILNGKKICFSHQRQHAEPGDILNFNGVNLLIVDVWYATYGFAKMRLYKIEGFETQKEYQNYMENHLKYIKDHTVLYHHFFSISDVQEDMVEL